MTLLTRTMVAFTVVASLAAQDRPYQEGDVDAFLKAASSNGRPAIVLYNFDATSG